MTYYYEPFVRIHLKISCTLRAFKDLLFKEIDGTYFHLIDLGNSRVALYLKANHLFAFVAQWIEQEPSNLLVAGSIPAEGAWIYLIKL